MDTSDYWPDALESARQGGDEIEHVNNQRERGYFIARLVRDAPDPRPRLLGADAYIEFLAACHTRLEEGRPIPANPEISFIFNEMREWLSSYA